VADQLLADEAQPCGALLVERFEFAVGVPPLSGEALEALDLARVEVGFPVAGNVRGGFHSGAIRAASEQIVKARMLRDTDVAGRERSRYENAP
jgi:hypothetical protein